MLKNPIRQGVVLLGLLGLLGLSPEKDQKCLNLERKAPAVGLATGAEKEDLNLSQKEKQRELARKITEELTLEEKIDQMVVVPVWHALKHQEQNFGGVFYPCWYLRQNFSDLKKLQRSNKLLGNRSIKPLIAIDQEGGAVDCLRFMNWFEAFCNREAKSFIKKYFGRLTRDGKGRFSLPGQNMILQAYLKTPEKRRNNFLKDFRDYAYNLAETLNRAGFTMNLAPVVDILSAPNSCGRQAYKYRTFGLDEIIAQRLIGRYIEGFNLYKNEEGSQVLSTAKHFPGLGSARTDTHHRIVIVNRRIDKKADKELRSYIAIGGIVPAMMLSHAVYPAIDRVHPSTASFKMREYLITKMGYEGIIISDDITMGALDFYEKKNRENRWRRLSEACDMILTVESKYRRDGKMIWAIEKIRAGIKEALSVEQITERTGRVVYTKLRYGLVSQEAIK